MTDCIADISTELNATMLMVLQNSECFKQAQEVADRENYLFHLANTMFSNRLTIASPGIRRDYLLGVHAYQVVSTTAFIDQPTFAKPPDERIAFDIASRIGIQTADQLIDTGISQVNALAEQVPLLTDALSEIVDRYTTSKGSARIALGGVAMMRSAHVQAAELLEQLHVA